MWLSPAWSRCARGALTAAGAALLLAGLLPANSTPVLAAGTISLTGGPYTEDFNRLSNVAGSTTNTVSILGWDHSESGDGARDDEQYAVDSGESLTGDTYSYGSADSAERAFGGLSEDTLIPTIGASFTNDTGAPITSVDIAYTGELWRLGTTDRVDRLDFQISTDATSLTTGTWTDVDALDFATPSTAAPTGQRDGNDAANRTSVSSSISGLSIPNRATFWIRWATFDAAGTDDGLAVDDFSLTLHADDAPAVSATDPADGATGVAPGGSVSVTFGEPVSVAGEWFTIECATSGAHAAAVSGGPTRFVLAPATEFAAGEECTVTVVAARVTDQDTDDPPDNPTADHVFSFTIQDAAPAEPPIANDDTASTREDSPIGVRVTANDTDIDGDLVPGTVRIVAPPLAGSATATADGTVRYTPDPNFHGRDRFAYRICDAGGRCDRAWVTVSVSSVRDRPVAGDVAVNTPEDRPVVIDITDNVVDPDGDLVPETVRIIVPPVAGSAAVTADGTVRYTPDPNFHGRDRFAYRMCDAGGRCDRAWVTVSVSSVGDRPVAGDVAVTTPEDRPVVIDITDNVVDPDGDLDVDSVVVVRAPAHGRAAVGASIRYTPDPNFHGRDTFAYRVCDTGGRCDRAWVTVSVSSVGDRPVAGEVAATTPEDRPVVIDITDNVVDPDGDLDVDSVVVVRAPAHGRAVVGASIRYTPDPNFHGRDRFVYRICDVTSVCVTGTVAVTIRPVNDAPAAVPDVVIVVRAGEVSIDVLANDADFDGPADLDLTSVTVVARPSLGTAIVNTTTGAIEYAASPGTEGTDQLTYRVCDLGGRCATATLDIRVDVPPTTTTTYPRPPGTLPTTGSNLATHAGAAALAAIGASAVLLAASRRTSLVRRRPSN